MGDAKHATERELRALAHQCTCAARSCVPSTRQAVTFAPWSSLVASGAGAKRRPSSSLRGCFASAPRGAAPAHREFHGAKRRHGHVRDLSHVDSRERAERSAVRQIDLAGLERAVDIVAEEVRDEVHACRVATELREETRKDDDHGLHARTSMAALIEAVPPARSRAPSPGLRPRATRRHRALTPEPSSISRHSIVTSKAGFDPLMIACAPSSLDGRPDPEKAAHRTVG